MNIRREVVFSYEGRRGCGHRKAGGLYLVSDGPAHACGKLPLVLRVCPTCGAGIRPARGWTWIDPRPLFRGRPCLSETCGVAGPAGAIDVCPVSDANIEAIVRCGLVWIGEQFYANPAAFEAEAASIGVSRRISAVPRGFEIGKTWVALGHRKGAFEGHEGEPIVNRGQATDETGRDHVEFEPAIFRMFKPERIEKVVDPDEAADDKAIDSLVKRGITPVIVKRLEDTAGPLFFASPCCGARSRSTGGHAGPPTFLVPRMRPHVPGQTNEGVAALAGRVTGVRPPADRRPSRPACEAAKFAICGARRRFGGSRGAVRGPNAAGGKAGRGAGKGEGADMAGGAWVHVELHVTERLAPARPGLGQALRTATGRRLIKAWRSRQPGARVLVGVYHTADGSLAVVAASVERMFGKGA